MRRTNSQASNELRHGNVMLDPGKRIATLAGEPLTLKPKEFALLELLMRNAGRVLPRKPIEETVYGTKRSPVMPLKSCIICDANSAVILFVP